MLTLQIKKKWFDMIVSGEKKEEYRERKKYYEKRFQTAVWHDGDSDFIEVRFRNGYGKDRPMIECLCTLTSGCGREEWGANAGQIYNILTIQKFKVIC